MPPEHWSPWTEVADREELRRRLEWLAEAGNLEESQLPFLLFFFRASDPVLYPPAAVALGRRLDRSPELKSWLREYASDRGIPLGGRVQLNGARNRRRVLLAGAGTVARDPESWKDLAVDAAEPDPLAPLPGHLPLEPVGDCVAYLRAATVLAEGSTPPAELPGRIREVLGEVAGHPRLMQERAVASSWGGLLRAGARPAGGFDREEAAELARGALAGLGERFRVSDAGGVGARLGTLRAADGLIRGCGELVDEVDLPPELRPPPLGLGGVSDLPEAAVRTALSDLFERLSEPRRWWSLAERERAETLFSLLACASDRVLPVRDLGALMDAHGCPESRRPAARILRLAALREGIAAGDLVDATLLHSLEDEGILLQLVPAGPDGDVGAILADALEHRIRMGLATEPGFRVETLLLRLEARRPHPGFYQLLRSVVGEREFTRPGGETVPLAEWLRALEAEARVLRDAGAAGVSEEPAVPGAEGEVRHEIRRRLLRLRGSSDPAALVEDLVEVLDGGASGDEAGRPRDVRSLLPVLDPDDDPGPEALHDRVEALREELGATVPAVIDGVPRARSAVEAIRDDLEVIEEEVAPRLPAAEAELLTDVLRRVDRIEDAWLRSLSRVEDAWDRTPAGSAAEERWSDVLEVAADLPHAAHRRRIYVVCWRTLVQDAGLEKEADAEGADVGMRSERLIRWALGIVDVLPAEEDREAWLEAVAVTWRAAVEAAMEDGLETRVARLVRELDPESVALLPGVDEVLNRVRVWFYDCYRPGDAARVSRMLNACRGRRSAAGLPGELFRFLLHYSPVWLALLVGALLMLDFGDPWTAMAEVADVRGIVVTFGLGVLGAFFYVTAELHSRVRDAPGDRVWVNRRRRLIRVSVFVAVALTYTLALVSLLWWLLSGTDAVVHGEGAFLHVIVWSGFALFVGVFLGLVAKEEI